jgi:phenylpropionate dioxygenase-like ring-hydroxylating dioxygenase large terminal subunit
MRHSEQVRILRQMLANVESGDFDLADGGSIAVDRYFDPARLERERRLFRDQPILVGFSSEIPNPGDFFVHADTGVPILVVRQEDRSVRAFVNVCRHRGAELATEPCGHRTNAFACPYHAWTYGLDGRLRSVTHKDAGFPALDLASRSLTALPAAEAVGMIFVRPTPGGAPVDLAEHMGVLLDDFAGFSLATHVVYEPKRFRKQADWKLFFDSSLESYHFRHVHRRTIASRFFDNHALWEWLPPHNSRNFLPKRAMVEHCQAPESEWNIREAGNLLYSLFPNTIFLVQPDHVTVMQTFPLGIGESQVRWTTLIPQAPQTDKARAHWDLNLKIFIDAIEEDFDMAESMQKGMASGANTHLSIARFEHQILRFHAALDEELAKLPA